MRNILLAFLLFSVEIGNAQSLQPGFIASEFEEMVRIYSRQGDSSFFNGIPDPAHHRMIYRSPISGLDNRWDLWLSDQNVAVISLRGTTSAPESWLQNYYSAMIDANGSIELNEKKSFSYHLSDREGATVHAGWVIGFAYLFDDIKPKFDSLYLAGVKNFVILGHSQGGAIGYYLTSQFLHMKNKSEIPVDVQFKSIFFAAPKPGNTQYAYDFETITHGGWAYNAVNADDWVPETPATVQTSTDFNKTNPFTDPSAILASQKFAERFVLKMVFGKLNKHPRKAEKVYQKYLGRKAYKYIAKSLPYYKRPTFKGSANYVRTGVPIVLQGDKNYYSRFPNNTSNFVVHHMMQPYYYLAVQYNQR